MSNLKMAEGHHTVTPYLIVGGAEKQIEFLQQVFNAEVTEKIMRSEGVIMHAEIKIGDSVIMLSDSTDEFRKQNAMLYVYVENTDEAYNRALKAGATSVRAPQDESYGARSGGVKDPFGNEWWFATLT
jgi:uncharacterized glyoxalase superfamily protein PhnB